MAADALDMYLTAMTSPEKKALPPHEQLSTSATLPDEYLMNYPIRNQQQATAAVRWQQQQPQLFYQELRRRTPHIAQRPILPKKSLNSWMAFRSFYQNLFPHLQQKEASVYLTTMWKRDPFKAKWTIIAAAYSKIRNAVGKPRAPLDRYLKIICPQMGIIAVDAYLGSFRWICDQTAEGNLLFIQATPPDLSTLGHHILHSSMTEKDVILYCGYVGYIRHNIAMRITGMRANHNLPQQGLFASAPTVDTPDTQGASSSTPTPQVDAKESRLEVPATTPAQATENYEWTGSMADLYHPSEGSIDFDRFFKSYHASPWMTTNIDNPEAFDTFVEDGGMCDGYLVPIVPHDPKSFQG